MKSRLSCLFLCHCSFVLLLSLFFTLSANAEQDNKEQKSSSSGKEAGDGVSLDKTGANGSAQANMPGVSGGSKYDSKNEKEGLGGDADATDSGSSARRELVPQEAQYGDFEEIKDAKTGSGTGTGTASKLIRLSGNIEEKNLAVEWNDWHNRFARTVSGSMFKSFWETINMRRGIIAWYYCEVTADRQIKNLKISKSSGDFWYDTAVIKAVQRLEGSSVLAFPANSRRTEISTEIGIRLGGAPKGDIDFGDVEYRELAPGEKPPGSDAENTDKNDSRSRRRRRS